MPTGTRPSPIGNANVEPESEPALAEVAPVTPVLDEVLKGNVVIHTAYRRDRRLSLGIALLLYGLVFLAFAFFWSYDRFGLTRVQGSWVGLGVFLVLLVSVALSVRVLFRSRAKSGSDSEAAAIRGSEAVIASYHQMTVRQAASSFRNSQVAMAVGLIVLIGGAVSVMRAADTSRQFVLGGLTALGSAFSGYLSATFLRAHDRALQQVNYLFSQPLVSHYLEYSRQIAQQDLEGEAARDSLVAIVHKALESAGEAVATPGPVTEPRLRRLRRVTRQSDAEAR